MRGDRLLREMSVSGCSTVQSSRMYKIRIKGSSLRLSSSRNRLLRINTERYIIIIIITIVVIIIIIIITTIVVIIIIIIIIIIVSIFFLIGNQKILTELPTH